VDDWDRGLWEFTLAAGDGGLADRLGEVSVPTLVVTGDADGIVSPDDSKRVAAAIPGAELVVVPEAGHLVMEERPDEFLGHLRRFLEGL
jgi:pimeloyl-ACP methyl ester carboxylesterase